MAELDIDDRIEEALDGGNRLKTKLPGVEITTQVADAEAGELEELHRRQLEFALEHAEDAKEATRL